MTRTIKVYGEMGPVVRYVVIFIFRRVLDLVDSSVIAPAIMTYVFWIFIPLIPLTSLTGGNWDWISGLFSFIPATFKFTNETALRGWQVITVAIFLLRSLIRMIFGKQKNVDLVEKIGVKIIFGFPIVSLLVSIILNILAGAGTGIGYYLMFIFLNLGTYFFLAVAWIMHGLISKYSAFWDLVASSEN